jgi:hypothetical protein
MTAWGDRPAIVFASYRCEAYGSPHPMPLIFDKGDVVGMGDLSWPWRPSYELAWVYGTGWVGPRGGAVLRHRVLPGNFTARDHPTQKPVALMEDVEHPRRASSRTPSLAAARPSSQPAILAAVLSASRSKSGTARLPLRGSRRTASTSAPSCDSAAVRDLPRPTPPPGPHRLEGLRTLRRDLEQLLTGLDEQLPRLRGFVQLGAAAPDDAVRTGRRAAHPHPCGSTSCPCSTLGTTVTRQRSSPTGRPCSAPQPPPPGYGKPSAGSSNATSSAASRELRPRRRSRRACGEAGPAVRRVATCRRDLPTDNGGTRECGGPIMAAPDGDLAVCTKCGDKWPRDQWQRLGRLQTG